MKSFSAILDSVVKMMEKNALAEAKHKANPWLRLLALAVGVLVAIAFGLWLAHRL